MRESHACGIKTSISLHFISDLLCIISLLFITIAKAFKCLQSVRFVSVQRSSEYLRTFSTKFGSLRKIVRNLQKWLGRFRKSRSWRDKNLTHLTQKKLAGIQIHLASNGPSDLSAILTSLIRWRTTSIPSFRASVAFPILLWSSASDQ